MIEEHFVSAARTNCWYESLLHQNYSSCQGQVSDFSDHIVLYFAQILPIPFMEVLHSLVHPFWNTISGTSSTGVAGTSFRIASSSAMVPILLISGLFYLYIVTFMGAYKTATYFHTTPEIINGFVISLLVQIPLFLMQCTTHMERAREYFFGFAL
jgi:hypothetical protein